MTKICSKCREEKNMEDFNVDRQAKTGRTYTCKSCNKARAAKNYRNNKTTVVKRVIAYRKKRKSTDTAFKIENNLRNRLHSALNGNYKADTTKALLGCTYEEACAHIEAQFAEGMSWDKMGLHGIHIDHIRPCASFDLTDPEQQRECFHYTNLQPLWAKDNLRKSDRW